MSKNFIQSRVLSSQKPGVWVLPLTLLAILCCSSPAVAAQLTVDDDLAECPAAEHRSIQSAVDAASPGDTISICPGSYTEGTGGESTNALTIHKSLVLRGADARLVTVQPSAANGNRIAGPAATPSGPNLRDDVGNIISILPGVKADISGISVKSNGVYVKTAVHFHNASGSLTNARVSDIVQTTGSGAYGVYQRGVGVGAFSTAANGKYDILLRDNLITGYNKGGVIIDSRNAAASTPSGSKVDAKIEGNVIQGGGRLPFDLGQNGIQVSFGGVAQITGNLIADNAFYDPLNPADGAQGVLLFGADQTTSVEGNNLQSNAFGLGNYDSNANDIPTPVNARNNWWGSAQGPAVPNLGAGETPGPKTGFGDPINSAASVSFAPFRSLQITHVFAPGRQDDHPPSVSIGTSGEISAGEPLIVSAGASDDVGIRNVSVSINGDRLAELSKPPYQVSYVPPVELAGQALQFTAVATDSSGQQNAAATRPLKVRGQGNENGGPPTISIASQLGKLPLRNTTPTAVSLSVQAPRGVASVTLAANGREICRFSEQSTYRCSYLPTGQDVGSTSLVATVNDRSGDKAQSYLTVRVPRFASLKPKVTYRVRKKRRDRALIRFSGKQPLPKNVSVADGCGGGVVTVTYQRKVKLVTLTRKCTFAFSLSLKRRQRSQLKVKFLGNGVLASSQQIKKTVAVK